MPMQETCKYRMQKEKCKNNFMQYDQKNAGAEMILRIAARAAKKE